MKKIIISIIAILLVVLTVGICYMKFSDNENKIDSKVEHKDELKDNKDVVQEPENIPDEKVDEPTQEEQPKTPSEEVVNKTTESTNTVVKQPSQPQVQAPSSNNSQTQKPTITPTPSTPKEEEVKPVPETPKVDPEYERLKKLAMFKTYEECNKVSNDLGREFSKDKNTNYRNTSCGSVAYDGKLLGYSLKIYYLDDTYSYYQG